MTIADRLTFLRIILAPAFFIAYFLPAWFPAWLGGGAGSGAGGIAGIIGAAWTVPLLWAIFVVSEITDMLDGMAARKLKQVSDFGKLFDPFADTLMQITCFLCFVIDGIFPAILLLIVVYREFGILFIRNLMLKKGVALGARMTGKIKTVAYIAASAAALLYASLLRLSVAETLAPALKIAAVSIFGVSVLFSVISFFDYLSVYRASGTAKAA